MMSRNDKWFFYFGFLAVINCINLNANYSLFTGIVFGFCILCMIIFASIKNPKP